MLNRRFRGRAILRLIFFAPYVISEVITGDRLEPDPPAERARRQPADRRSASGTLSQPWLADPDIVLIALFVIISWKYFGFHMILLLAGLQGIPRELEEAAAIDGASRRQSLRYVTLPLLGPTLRVSVFLSIIGALQLFDLIWVTTGGGPVNASNTMATYMFDWGFVRFQLGYGSAVAVILFVICFVIALAYQRFVLRRDTEGATTTAESTTGTVAGRRDRLAGRALGVRIRRVGRSSCATSLLLVVAGVIVMPVVYAVLGGFRDAARSRPTPSACPIRGCRPTTPTRSRRRASGDSSATAPWSPRSRRSSWSCSRAGRVRLRAPRVPRSRGRVHVVHPGLLFPVAVAILPLLILVRGLGLLDNPLGRRAAPGGVRAAADDHHPAAVLPEHPERARGRGRDRRLRPVRVLLAGPAAASRSRPSRRSRSSPSSPAGTRSCCRW